MTDTALDLLVRVGVENVTAEGLASVEGSINNLLKEQIEAFKKLEAAKKATNDPTQLKAYNAEQNRLLSNIKKLQSEFDNTNKKASEFSKTLAKIKEGFIQGLGVGAGFGVAQVIQSGIIKTREFIADASRLASEAEGVNRAFGRLNQPGLLDELRKATRGTVSDLELMKQAVQFNNFGLPLEQLASGLEFARIRAKETGQSVEFLVQSIVTGIGRQSPLILDNLGINARRVREEFQKTGDFALAAFKIIQEETAKAGEDLETFAERMGKINTEVDNFKVKFGNALNFTAGALLELGSDFADLFTGDFQFGEKNLDRYIQKFDEAIEKSRQLQREQATANAIFGAEFKRFADQYVGADLTSRQKIEAQAKSMYESILEGARTFYGNDLDRFNTYATGLKSAYAQLTSFFSKSKINLKTLTTDQLTGLTREELTLVSEQITNARNALTVNDTAEINRLNTLDKAVKNLLATISGSNVDKLVDKAAKAVAAKEAARLEFQQNKINYTKEELERFESEQKDSIDRLKKYYEELSGFVDGLLRRDDLADNLNEFDSFMGTTPPGDTPEDLARQLQLYQQIKAIKKQISDQEAEDFEKRKQNIQRVENEAQFYNEQYTLLLGSLSQFISIEQAKTDALITEQQRRVESAKLIAKNGNAELLQAEQERLDALEKKRREYAEDQATINAALVASQSAVNVVQAVGAVLSATPGDPYTLAARVIAAVAAVVGGIASVTAAINNVESAGFYKGGFTGDGDPKERAGDVHKGEYVFDHKATRRIGKENLEALRHGRIPIESMPGFMSVNYAGMLATHNDIKRAEREAVYDMRRIEGKFDMLLEAFNTRGGTSLVIDENGVVAMMDKAKRNKLVYKTMRRIG